MYKKVRKRKNGKWGEDSPFTFEPLLNSAQLSENAAILLTQNFSANVRDTFKNRDENRAH